MADHSAKSTITRSLGVNLRVLQTEPLATEHSPSVIRQRSLRHNDQPVLVRFQWFLVRRDLPTAIADLGAARDGAYAHGWHSWNQARLLGPTKLRTLVAHCGNVPEDLCAALKDLAY